MIDLTTIFDRYNRQARLAPALIVIFPVPLVLLSWFPDLQLGLGLIASLAGTFGIILLIAQLARDRGKRREAALFKEWGGKPSVALLRWRDDRIDQHTKARYCAFLAPKIPTAQFPSLAQELADPAAADVIYEAATQWLLAKTRDTKSFPLLFQENISYGFRRNLLGLKPYGIAIALAVAAISSAAVAYCYIHAHSNPPILVAVTSLAAWAFALWWILGVRSSWVKIPADQYGLHLLASCTALDGAEQAATHR